MTDQLIELPPTAIDPSSAYMTGASGPALNPTYRERRNQKSKFGDEAIATYRRQQSMSRLDNVMSSIVEHETTSPYDAATVNQGFARRKNGRTISLLLRPQLQAKIPHQRSLLITD